MPKLFTVSKNVLRVNKKDSNVHSYCSSVFIVLILSKRFAPLLTFIRYFARSYSEPSKISKIKDFAKIVSG